MKRKRTPPSEHIVSGLAAIQPGYTVQETKQAINSFLTTNVMYVGDMKQLAERYGCHYLKSKRMRTRALQQFVVDNHPAVKNWKSPELVVGVDWGIGPDKTAITICGVNDDGSLRVIDSEVIDERQGQDRRGVGEGGKGTR